MRFELKTEEVIKNCVNAVYSSLGMVVEIVPPKRSKDQNSYYWVILSEIAKTQGQSKEDVHDELKWRVLGPDYVELAGKQVARIKPSRNLTKEDFGKLIDAAEMTAQFLDIQLKPPSYFGLSA